MWGDLACIGVKSRGRRAYLSLLRVPRERRRTGAAEGTTLCRCRLFIKAVGVQQRHMFSTCQNPTAHVNLCSAHALRVESVFLCSTGPALALIFCRISRQSLAWGLPQQTASSLSSSPCSSSSSCLVVIIIIIIPTNSQTTSFSCNHPRIRLKRRL